MRHGWNCMGGKYRSGKAGINRDILEFSVQTAFHPYIIAPVFSTPAFSTPASSIPAFSAPFPYQRCEFTICLNFTMQAVDKSVDIWCFSISVYWNTDIETIRWKITTSFEMRCYRRIMNTCWKDKVTQPRRKIKQEAPLTLRGQRGRCRNTKGDL